MACPASFEHSPITVLTPSPSLRRPAVASRAPFLFERWLGREDLLRRFLRRMLAVAKVVLSGACRSRDEPWSHPALQPPSGSVVSLYTGPRFP
jgi:hypothetical protein